MPRQRLLLFSLLTFALGCLVSEAFATPLYKLTKSVALGSPERWDLLTFDPDSNRVYIAHGDRVTVVDGQSGTVIGNVEGFSGGTHGVALVPALNTGYSDDGKAGAAGAFDLKSLKLTKQIKAQDDADAVVFDPASGHVFVIDSDPGKVTVIDPKTNTNIATIDGGGKLEIAATDGTGNLYVNGEAKAEIVRIDTETNKVTAHWPIAGCSSPHGLAVDPQARRLFASCENNVLLVVDAGSGKVISSLPIGARTDGAAFDPVRKRAFSSNGDGTLTVISEKSPNSFEVLGTVQTEPGARTMTIDPRSGRVYLVSAEIRINEAGAPNDFRNRFKITPGSTHLLIYDPVS